jgi:chromosomal replication initiation ATPase DnaA
MTKNHFELKSKKLVSSLKVGDIISESDLCIQDNGHMYQFKFHESEKQKRVYKVDPGIFSFAETRQGVILKDIELQNRELLTSALSTQSIVDEANRFFNNLHVYERLNEPKSRKILLYSDPGCGKSSAIAHYCNQQIKEDPGTVVMVWPTSEIDSDDVSDFLASEVEYNKECTKLILIMEDIGGGEREGGNGRSPVDSAMLDLLDGIKVNFKIPTLIIATTNFPQNMMATLADRPGRFDLMLEIEPPSKNERVKIVEFIAKDRISAEDEEELIKDDYDKMSIAHLKEAVVRSLLHGKTIATTLKELTDHRKLFNNSFEKRKEAMGFDF